MGSTFPFLDEPLDKEWLCRVQILLEPLEKEHKKLKANVLQDYVNRKLPSSSACVVDLFEVDMDFICRMASILRGELFEILEKEKIKPDEEIERSISNYIAQAIKNRSDDFIEDSISSLKSMGLGSPTVCDVIHRSMQGKVQSAIQRHAYFEVHVRASDLRRKRRDETRSRWGGRINTGIGFILGIGATLLALWLAKILKLG